MVLLLKKPAEDQQDFRAHLREDKHVPGGLMF